MNKKLSPEAERLNEIWDMGAKKGIELRQIIEEEAKGMTPDERYMFFKGLTSEFSYE